MPAHRKLDAHAVEQIVAARAAGSSYREIAASLDCSHSTVSRPQRQLTVLEMSLFGLPERVRAARVTA